MKEQQELTLIKERTGRLEDDSSFTFRHFEPANTNHVTVVEVIANPRLTEVLLSDILHQLLEDPRLTSFPMHAKVPAALSYSSFRRYIDRINQWASERDIVIHLLEDS